jgi:hypothetical protein
MVRLCPTLAPLRRRQGRAADRQVSDRAWAGQQRGQQGHHRARAARQGIPLWNAKEGGWVVSKKHEAKMRDVIAALASESITQKPQETAQNEGKRGPRATPHRRPKMPRMCRRKSMLTLRPIARPWASSIDKASGTTPTSIGMAGRAHSLGPWIRSRAPNRARSGLSRIRVAM